MPEWRQHAAGGEGGAGVRGEGWRGWEGADAWGVGRGEEIEGKQFLQEALTASARSEANRLWFCSEARPKPSTWIRHPNS